MMDLLPLIASCADTCCKSLPQITQTKAELSSRKLQESLLSLERRMRSLELVHYELVNADLMIGATRSLYDVQLDFVDRLESFHQQVYVTLSCLGYYLQFILNPHGPRGKELNSNKRLIKYLENFVSDEVKSNFLPVLELSRSFRSQHVDHPHHNGGMYDFGTSSHGSRAVAFFFTTKPDAVVPTDQNGALQKQGAKVPSKSKDSQVKGVQGFVSYDISMILNAYPWIDDCYVPPHHQDVYASVNTVISNILMNRLENIYIKEV